MKKILPLLILSTLLLSGCGGDSLTESLISDTSKSYYSNSASSYDSLSEDYYSESDNEYDIVKETQMIARTARISVDVDNLEDFDTNIQSTVEKYKGYIVSSEIENYSNDYSTRRYSYYTIKIPADKLDEFLNITEEGGTVTSKSVEAEDVSLDYVDVNAHIGVLENEVESLNELLSEATSVSEILEIKSELSDVQAQLDSYTARKELLESRVNYSEVTINATEEREVEHPIAERLDFDFTDSVTDMIVSGLMTLIGIIIALPAIAIVTGFIILFLWIIKKVIKKVFKIELFSKKKIIVVKEEDIEGK